MDSFKKPSGALGRQNNPTLDGTLHKKRLSVSVSGNEHKLLGVPSLRNNLRKYYGKIFCEEVMNLLKNGTR